MKPHSQIRRLWNFLLALTALALTANAQTVSLTVAPSATTIALSNSVTFTVNVTNTSATNLPSVTVKYTPSATVTVNSANTTVGTGTNLSGSFVFNLGTITNGTGAQMSLTITPVAAGLLISSFTAASSTSTNLAQTNIFVQVTGSAELGLGLRVPRNIALNDWFTYSVNVTNFGPNSVNGVILTNSGSPGITVLSVTPTNQFRTFTNGLMIIELGTLTNGEIRRMKITAQSPNPGTNFLISGVGALAFQEANPTNNYAGGQFNVADYLPSQLSLSLISPTQTFNPRTGLMEQTIRIRNDGASSVPAIRVAVTNLQYWLFNAVGTNSALGDTNGLPFVTHATTLASGESVDLLMEYFVPTGLPFAISTNHFLANAVPAPDLSPINLGTQISFSRQPLQLASGAMLVEFPSTPGRSYTIVYASDMSFADAKIAPPAISAAANRKQWIDYGPPKTVSSPASGGNRFYKVYLNPTED